MLGVLGAVLIGLGYYYLVYVKQVAKVEELNVKKVEVQQRYDTIMETIKTMDKRKGKIKVFNAGIQDKSKLYYEEIIQENIILEIDKLINDSGISGNVSFTPITVGQVEVVNVQPNIKGESSLKPIVDEYENHLNGESSNSEVKQQETEKVEGTDGVSETEESTKDAAKEEVVVSDSPVVAASGTTVEQLKVNMSFTSTYEELKKFLDLVDSESKKLVVSNLSLTQSKEQEISGSLTLEFYGIPKIAVADVDKLTWELNNTYGKETPFSNSAATGNTTIESLAEQKEAYDFIMLAKPINSDLPTVMMGKSNDKENLSYVYADNKGIEAVELVLTKVGAEYYYKYKTTNGSYPGLYNGNGQLFTPIKDDITLEIMSQSRLDDNDLSGVQLTIVNNTDKILNVVVNGDDATKPRLTIESEGTAVKVTKK